MFFSGRSWYPFKLESYKIKYKKVLGIRLNFFQQFPLRFSYIENIKKGLTLIRKLYTIFQLMIKELQNTNANANIDRYDLLNYACPKTM